MLASDELEGFGSLITIKGTNTYLGDLMHFEGHGTFDPDHGLVPVTKDEADVHNKAMDEARLTGLDENCEVGQTGFFYFRNDKGGRMVIHTFIGMEVACQSIRVKGQSITFVRKGKTFRGRLSRQHDVFNFRRVA
ncbi:MAG: hypothetical protein ACLQNE_32025 [Thermoguttaceae bacterium]|jgi:hypothetical protein